LFCHVGLYFFIKDTSALNEKWDYDFGKGKRNAVAGWYTLALRLTELPTRILMAVGMVGYNMAALTAVVVFS